jgi:hypothetical protein
MAKQKVVAQLSDKKNPVTVEFDFGDSLESARKLFGDEVIWSRAKSALTIDLQALIRRMIKAGKTAAEIHTAVAAWKPDVKTLVKKSASEKISDLASQLTPEERKALLKQLQSA